VERETLSLSRPELASWRESGGQNFVSESELSSFAKEMGVTLTHRINSDDLPKDHKGVLEWLEKSIPHTYAALDDEAQNKAEGVVVRSTDRRMIAKIRFADYRRTLGIK